MIYLMNLSKWMAEPGLEVLVKGQILLRGSKDVASQVCLNFKRRRRKKKKNGEKFIYAYFCYG